MNPVSLALLLALGFLGGPSRGGQQPTGDDAATATEKRLSDAEVDRRARAYLGAIDRPVSAARWRALGPRAVSSLEAVVRDPRSLPSRRVRALDALSILGGARAQAITLELAGAEDQPFGVRAHAMRGAARLVPAASLASHLGPVMRGAGDAAVRAAAAEVLAQSTPGSSCAAVRAQEASEAPEHRPHFQPALQACAAAGNPNP